MAKTPNYILTEDYTFSEGPYDTKTLTAGMFIRPIKVEYVPKHILESYANKWFNEDTQTYCFCRFGIIAVPKNKIREV